MHTVYLLPLTILALALALVALGYRVRRRRGYGLLALGVAAAAMLLAGKFVLGWDLAVYTGLAVLIGASMWNSWPRRPAVGVPAAPAETLCQIGSVKKEK